MMMRNIPADMMAHGFAYVTLNYSSIEPDNQNGLKANLARGLALSPGQTEPARGRMGCHRRLGVGHQPARGLSGDRDGGGRQAHRHHGRVPAGQDRHVGGCPRHADRDGDRQLLGRGRRGAEPPQLRRDDRASGRAGPLPVSVLRQLRQVGATRSTNCPSMRTCSSR